jgi:hypothetical protein
MKFYFLVFLKNLSRKFRFHQHWIRIKGTLHKDKCAFLIIFRSIFLRMKNVSDKSCTEAQNTHFVLNNVFFNICHVITWKNIVQRDNMAHAHSMLDT